MLLLLYQHCRSAAAAAEGGDVHRRRRSHCSMRHGSVHGDVVAHGVHGCGGCNDGPSRRDLGKFHQSYSCVLCLVIARDLFSKYIETCNGSFYKQVKYSAG